MKKGVTLATLLLIIISLLIGGIQVYARESWQHNGITTNKPSPQLVGNNIALTANVKGSTEGLQYKSSGNQQNQEIILYIQILEINMAMRRVNH